MRDEVVRQHGEGWSLPPNVPQPGGPVLIGQLRVGPNAHVEVIAEGAAIALVVRGGERRRRRRVQLTAGDLDDLIAVLERAREHAEAVSAAPQH